MEAEETETEEHTVHSPAGDNQIHPNPRRRICINGCDRPINVCLCDKIPKPPISSATQIVILQHPLEKRHKLATVPIISKCLENCQVIIGRRLRRGASPLLDSLCDYALLNPNQPRRSVFLFPGSDTLPSVEINHWKKAVDCDPDASSQILIAFDATWKHAIEMVHASLPFLTKFAVQVCLNCDVRVDGGTIFDSDLILRKEPFSGCMSTMEAIARCLKVLERDGAEIEETLVEVLRAMVRFQACFLKPMKPRMKLLRRGKLDDKKTIQNTSASTN